MTFYERTAPTRANPEEPLVKPTALLIKPMNRQVYQFLIRAPALYCCAALQTS
jgi:hypothetical protein